MYHNNSSSSSLGSRKSHLADKDLPPIPSPHGAAPHVASPLTPHAPLTPQAPLPTEIMEAKTLKRKNLKQLSLGLEAPATARVAPAGPAPADGDALAFAPSSLTEKRNRKGTKLVNFTLNLTPVALPGPQVLLATSTALALVINQFLHLDIQPAKTPTSAPHLTGARKRQTVISLISPTKLVTSAGLLLLAPLPHGVAAGCNSPGVPLTTTPSGGSAGAGLQASDLVTLKDLGAGNSGTVTKVLHVPTQRTMAKKVIHVDSKLLAVQNQIVRELKILHECQLPYIIEFYGAFVNTNNTIVMCMEYCNCGLLDKILGLCPEAVRFPLYVLKKLSYVMLMGLTYLYREHKIVHRDIKPQNVLMNHRGEFKLCDFGVLRELKTLGMADTFVGTLYYMSPERIQGGEYGVKSDVWSMGIMLIELARGRGVWDEEEAGARPVRCPEGILDLLQRIVNEQPPSLSRERYDAQLCRLIDSCLIKDDRERKAPWDVLHDPFLAGVAAGGYDKEVRAWAKTVRKAHKDK